MELNGTHSLKFVVSIHTTISYLHWRQKICLSFAISDMTNAFLFYHENELVTTSMHLVLKGCSVSLGKTNTSPSTFKDNFYCRRSSVHAIKCGHALQILATPLCLLLGSSTLLLLLLNRIHKSFRFSQETWSTRKLNSRSLHLSCDVCAISVHPWGSWKIASMVLPDFLDTSGLGI